MVYEINKKLVSLTVRSLTTVDSISSIAKKTGTVEATFCIGTFSIWIAVVSHQLTFINICRGRGYSNVHVPWLLKSSFTQVSTSSTGIFHAGVNLK